LFLIPIFAVRLFFNKLRRGAEQAAEVGVGVTFSHAALVFLKSYIQLPV
jgi:hypothetical protein